MHTQHVKHKREMKPYMETGIGPLVRKKKFTVDVVTGQLVTLAQLPKLVSSQEHYAKGVFCNQNSIIAAT